MGSTHPISGVIELNFRICEDINVIFLDDPIYPDFVGFLNWLKRNGHKEEHDLLAGGWDNQDKFFDRVATSVDKIESLLQQYEYCPLDD